MCYITWLLLLLPHLHIHVITILYFILFLISGKIPTSKSAIGGGDIEIIPRLQGQHHILIHVKPRHSGLEFVLNTLSTIPGNWYISVIIKIPANCTVKGHTCTKRVQPTHTRFWLNSLSWKNISDFICFCLYVCLSVRHSVRLSICMYARPFVYVYISRVLTCLFKA